MLTFQKSHISFEDFKKLAAVIKLICFLEWIDFDVDVEITYLRHPPWQGDGVRSTLFFKDLSERYEKITDNRNGFQMTPESEDRTQILSTPTRRCTISEISFIHPGRPFRLMRAAWLVKLSSHVPQNIKIQACSAGSTRNRKLIQTSFRKRRCTSPSTASRCKLLRE